MILTNLEKLALLRMSAPSVLDLRTPAGNRNPRSLAFDIVSGDQRGVVGMPLPTLVELSSYESACKKIGIIGDVYERDIPHKLRSRIKELGLDLRPIPAAQPINDQAMSRTLARAATAAEAGR